MRRMKIKPDDMPEKPASAMMLEQMESFGALPLEGGLLAQPHLLMREIEIARRVKTVFENSYQNYLVSLQGKN